MRACADVHCHPHQLSSIAVVTLVMVTIQQKAQCVFGLLIINGYRGTSFWARLRIAWQPNGYFGSGLKFENKDITLKILLFWQMSYPQGKTIVSNGHDKPAGF